ncbi:mitochondrial dynamin family protein AgDFP2 [Andalucia godoyi]|uniref:Mitochondrial dynamin family protein AgDFP2 n=1 Tax=Andalucia godoyi TaxID=505711 RepID=A0A8K0AJT1_ANDGO|nr:mitochondrial dynamin family protein AgDFP2 [Andalucia godoyi]|eukprot:ANDGO_08796.mRNA.1 mitochondrial dynamin family protein AgDFP2 (novel dynamin-related protein)
MSVRRLFVRLSALCFTPLIGLATVKPSCLSAEDLSAPSSLLTSKWAQMSQALRKVDYAPPSPPMLVVVGDQSSGKSSLLESLVGEPFLPTGDGTVTKRPIMITLQPSSTAVLTAVAASSTPHRLLSNLVGSSSPPSALDSSQAASVTYAIPSQQIITTDASLVARTLASLNMEFDKTPIDVVISGAHLPSLILVDLPGLVSVPRTDQPRDLRTTIRSLVGSFAANPNAIVVAIVPATSDIQTSEALRFAQRHDSDGSRTVVVVTKTDLVPLESRSAVLDNIRSLQGGNGRRLGRCWAVRCRSRADVDQGVSMRDARARELALFRDWQVGSEALFPACAVSGEVSEFDADGIVGFGLQSLARGLSKMLEARVSVALSDIAVSMRHDLQKLHKYLDAHPAASFGSSSGLSDVRVVQKAILVKTREIMGETLSPQVFLDLKDGLLRGITASLLRGCEQYTLGRPGSGVNDKLNVKVGEEQEDTQKNANNAHRPRTASPVNGDADFEVWKAQVRRIFAFVGNHTVQAALSESLSSLRSAFLEATATRKDDFPQLTSLCRRILMAHLDVEAEKLAAKLQDLVRLEQNVTIQRDTLASNLFRFKTAKEDQIKLLKQEAEAASTKEERAAFLAQLGVAKAVAAAKNVDQYSNLYTMGHLLGVSERVAANVFNAVCVDLLEDLRESVCDMVLVEAAAMPLDERRKLVEERPEVLDQRRRFADRALVMRQVLEELERLARSAAS